MTTPDQVFQQTYAWYQASVARVLSTSPVPAAQAAAVEAMIWQALGVLDAAAPPANPALEDFRDSGADAASLALATTVIAETLAALGYVKQAVNALTPPGNPAAALAVLGPVMAQIDRLSNLQANSRYPSAFSLGKMLLMISGDAEAAPAAGHEADKLAQLLGAATADEIADGQAALGLVALLVGSMIDRSFTAPATAPASGWVTQPILPDLGASPTLTLKGPPGVRGTLQMSPGPQSRIKAALDLTFDQTKPIGDTNVQLKFTSTAAVGILVPVLPLGAVQVSGAYTFGLDLVRSAPALDIATADGSVRFSVGTLGIGLKLQNETPSLSFFARDIVAAIKPQDGFLKLVLGDGITLKFDIDAAADKAGKLRLTNGTGLVANLPIPTLPTGPFKLQAITLGLDPVGGSFSRLQVEASASFGVALGPFQASVERLGVLLTLNLGGGAPIAFAFKPPNGIGLALDAGIVKGGGFLAVDEQGYAGVLELKMLAIGVKAIAILNTRSEAGFSLLLLIFGQFPAIQLSFGFTLTGVGGLIGVQHTASPPALSQALSAGSLDAVLFPDNPVANAPQIINTLRTVFPVKAGGFIIGPMLELGWSTPSLVTVRLGLLIEATQFTLLGQAIIQLPPLVSADLALLYLRLDFVGTVVFSPLKIAFDAKLIHSRVAFISITGQFAFRASFGDQPTFLISAGGFHPRFKEIPSDIPSPFDRVGCSFDIGVVGVSFKGYFAITSATVQAGSDLKVWADIGIASIEGGWGFDAICYLAPKFYFEVDLHAYLAIHVFGADFASVRLEGLLAGPGRWHIVGKASVHTPWPLPDFSLDLDESWGTDRATPAITVNVAKQLTDEIANRDNWSAQLPRGGESFLSLANIKPGPDQVLAHPLGTLVFQQKLVPFDLRMDKASGSAIDGANEFGHAALTLTSAEAAVDGLPPASTRSDFFAAAQFFEMSQDDKIGKPSFESFTAGYELGSDAFDLGEVIPETLNYEEVDLGAPRTKKKARRRGFDAFAQNRHGVLMQFGSAGLSSLRDRALIQPAQSVALRVDPAPVVVTDRSTTAAALGGSVYTSFWKAEQSRTATVSTTSAAATKLHVMDLAEVTA